MCFILAFPLCGSGKDLVARMLTVDPKLRITASEVLQHPWLRQQQVRLARVSGGSDKGTEPGFVHQSSGLSMPTPVAMSGSGSIVTVTSPGSVVVPSPRDEDGSSPSVRTVLPTPLASSTTVDTSTTNTARTDSCSLNGVLVPAVGMCVCYVCLRASCAASRLVYSFWECCCFVIDRIIAWGMQW